MNASDLKAPELSPRQVNQARVAGQCLRTRGNRDDLIKVVRAVCGVNAQNTQAMMLSLRARTEGLESKDVEEALEKGIDIVRAWAMRGTVHLMVSSDIQWIVSTLGPAEIAMGRRRYRELGLCENILERGLAEIPLILAATPPLTRWELMDELEAKGLSIERNSQAPIHLIRYVALHNSICLGPDRKNGEVTYTVLKSPSAGSSHGGRVTGRATRDPGKALCSRIWARGCPRFRLLVGSQPDRQQERLEIPRGRQ